MNKGYRDCLAHGIFVFVDSLSSVVRSMFVTDPF